MSHKQSRFFKECHPPVWSLEEILVGLQRGQLSKKLPTRLQILICNMSIAFSVYCVGASESTVDKKSIQNVRDVNCLVHKLSWESPEREYWTCWPCMDFLRKFKPKVWKLRMRTKLLYKVDAKPQRFRKAHCFTKKNNVEIRKKEPRFLDGATNAILINLTCGVIHVSPNGINHRSPFLRKSMKSASTTIPRWPDMTKFRGGTLNRSCYNFIETLY